MLSHLLRLWMPPPPRRAQAAGRRLDMIRLEDRVVPTVGFATGSGPGVITNQVNVFDTTGALRFSFNAFPGFTGGVNVATGDLNGDGNPDVVVGAGRFGGPHVKVYDGATLELGGAPAQNAVNNPLKSFFAYAGSFAGGVNVAVGDINGDGFNDIITGAGPGGGPHVKVFDFATLNERYSFFAYGTNFIGGVNVAAGNVGGDTGNPPVPSHPGIPSDELITGEGPGGGPHVKVFGVNLTDPTRLDGLASFFAYAANFRGGVSVGSNFLTRNLDPTDPINPTAPFADIVVGPGFGGGPHVKIYRLDNGQNTGDPTNLFTFLEAASFFAYAPNFFGGVNVAATPDLNGDGIPDFVTGAGPGGGPHLIGWAGQALNDLETYAPPIIGPINRFVYDGSFNGGVNVG